MKKLRDERPESTACHDDRALCSKWSSRSDRDGGRDWFEKSNLRLDQATAQQNCLQSFRDSVATDLLRTVTGHESDDERANHRRSNHPHAQMMVLQVGKRRGKLLEEDDVGQLCNQPEEDLCHDCAYRAD